MVSQKVVIKNPTGLHLRPAGILCKEAMQFKSLITFTFRGNTANAKSVLSVLGACVKCGDEIEIICEGEDEAEALRTLVGAIESGLGEERERTAHEQGRVSPCSCAGAGCVSSIFRSAPCT